MFHTLAPHLIEGIEPPALFTNPFDYEPHPLVEVAARELCNYLSEQAQWHDEIERGKMFGVLVVRNAEGEVGYLVAFSGYLDKQTRHNFFVPPICDLLEEEGFYKIEESAISKLNKEIAELESDPKFNTLSTTLSALKARKEGEIETLKTTYRTARIERKALRQICTDTSALDAESQRQKGQIKRAELQYRQEREALEHELEGIASRISALKAERAKRSCELQRLIFKNFVVLNAHKQGRDLLEIFKQYNNTIPPAGSGECAAPKLMHYAYANDLMPIAMGEFWRGASPKGEVRHDMHYYAACRGKCHPILGYMLQGLEVEQAPHREERVADKLEKIFEDEALVAFNKPSGLPTVRGLNHEVSLQSIVEELYPDNINHHIVHRLDMDTSGAVVIAKSAEVQRNLQEQFAAHTIRKRYIAIVEGEIEQAEGSVELPLIMNPLDRPRQMVDYELGKSAYTRYTRLSTESNRTRLALYPHTGRTHQLRVHCAHCDGLNTPIVGDRLYGRRDERLMLHCEQMLLRHPITGRKLYLTAESEF